MRYARAAMLSQCVCSYICLFLVAAPAQGQPVTGSGAEVVWSTPQKGALLDLTAGNEKSVSLASPRRLPARGWLVTEMQPGEVAWVHLDGDRDAQRVRFAYLSGGVDSTVAIDAAYEQRGAGDFVFTAPPATGPFVNRLAIGVREGQLPPSAQIWVGGVKSPGYRWELWEETAKKWATRHSVPPPAPPDLVAEPLVARLALIQDALALAQAESKTPNAELISTLLRAEALLANLPAREPIFPYFKRYELTGKLAKSRRVMNIESQRMMEVPDAQPLSFTVEGPSLLRIEARTRYEKNAQHHSSPLRMVLHAGGRLVGLAVEEVLPTQPKDAPADQSPISSRRRILIAAAPGRHTYELQVRGGPAWVAVIVHTRDIHAEQLANHSEDIPRMLEHVRSQSRLDVDAASSALSTLLDAEVSYLSLDDARARELFQLVADKTRQPRLRAFAMLRLATLTPPSDHDRQPAKSGLALLGDGQDEATGRLRNMLIAEQLIRIIAESEPDATPPSDAVALLLLHPEVLTYMPAYAGPLLRFVPGPRSLALPLLAAAQAQSPLDALWRHVLSREWFTGTRWAALPAQELANAQPVEILAPPAQLTTCDEAGQQGAQAYAPLSEKDSELDVPQNLAPGGSLHRFHLVALHSGTPHLSWAFVTLDGQQSRLPLLLPRERLPFALAAGRHTLHGTLREDKVGSLLGPCSLLRQPSDIALLMEHRFSELNGRNAQVRVEVPGAGTPAFVGIELRAAAALRGGRLLLRTEQGVIGHLDVSGHGLDTQLQERALGPAILIALPLPAATRTLDIVREDNGAPLVVRTLLRRSLSRPERATPELPMAYRGDAELLDALRQATRARRAAQDPAAVARAQLKRAEILSLLQAVALSRIDAERALPKLADSAAQERTHRLLATLKEPSLLPPRPNGPGAVMLAPGASLPTRAEDEACVTHALSRFAASPAAGRAAVKSCSGTLGRYAAACIAERDGNAEEAAHDYAAAYLASGAAGEARPALARESALRYAERGPGPGSQEGLALATTAAQEADPDGDRAVQRVRILSHSRVVRAVDVGEVVKADEGEVAPVSVRAALADEPWEAGRFLEVRAGKLAETDFEAKQPIRLRLDLLCDDGGEPAAVAVTPPCNLRVEIDGVAVSENRIQTVRAGEQTQVSDLALDRGFHRLQVTLARRHAVPGPSDGGLAFVHLASNRPLVNASAQPDSQGMFTVPIMPPPTQRFIATPEQPVQLRVQGPTVLRLDTLAKHGQDKRAITVELSRDGKAATRREYPICTQPADHPAHFPQPGFDCRTAVTIPLVTSETYRVVLRAVGTPGAAMALTVFEDEPTDEAGPAKTAPPQLLADGEKPIGTDMNPALRLLRRPDSNWLRGLGTLQVQTLGVIGSAGSGDPSIGDKYSETAIYYRRKLDELPLWFKVGALLHLREGPASFGLDGLAFARIPVIQLRIFTELQAFTQSVDDTQAYSLAFHGYLERSFQVLPHLFILPRFGVTENYQSLPGRPLDAATTGGQAQDGAAVSAAVTPIDPNIYNRFDATHGTAIYGQLLMWWVPFINMIVYSRLRLTSNASVQQLDSVKARVGFDMAITTTEIVSYYEISQLLADDARPQSLLRHQLAAEVGQTVWLNRNHRLGFLVSGNVDVVSRATTFIFGMFWEGSRNRGLDDYSTPEINLPQQLGQGRGSQRPEETLR